MKMINYGFVSRIAASLLLLIVPLTAKSAEGAGKFQAKCAACHGPDGSGATPIGKQMKIHDLRLPEVQKRSDAELTAIITAGKTPMPAFGKTLSPADITALVAFLRSIASKS